MPKRTDIHKVLVIGSGPIVIGQAAEFDYAGTQACRALKEEGVETVLVNSNPATIMTDPGIADRVYMEPLTVPFLKRILHKERPDALLPSLGGQTGLNMALALHEDGVLEELGIEILGTDMEAIDRAENRESFRSLMHAIGEPVPPSCIAQSVQEALDFAEETGFPLIVRPAFTLGGTGGGFCADAEELAAVMENGLLQSPVHQCLVEMSIAGWKEIEFEVLRDGNDTAIIVCSMENIDPVGVHTGDSIVVAPAMTLADREYERLRDAALRIVRTLGIEGGCNVQLALDPHSFDYFVIEVNPRVSRSSALASKATGFPIALLSTKIAVGYRLDELKNPITDTSYCCYEPAVDYVALKLPRFAFDKFQSANRRLGTQMKATGEVMALGRTFEEALLKAVRSLENKAVHIERPAYREETEERLWRMAEDAEDERLFALYELLRRGKSVEELSERTGMDPFFLHKIANIAAMERAVKEQPKEEILRDAKRMGFSDAYLAQLWSMPEEDVEALRLSLGVVPVYKMVDTCAAEFPSQTPYLYSTYEKENESVPSKRGKILVLGSGPIRIGQGVEFDYATVHCVQALQRRGWEAVIVNNNPETVSTDFSISDKLYFEPLTTEDVMHIVRLEQPEGVIVQFGGQTAINLAESLAARGVRLLGTPLDAIDLAEDRDRFEQKLKELGIPMPEAAMASEADEAVQKANAIGYPVLMRPSYVLGGRNMAIVRNDDELIAYMEKNRRENGPDPVLIDRYVIGMECEVDAVSDGTNAFIPGVLQHIERAGVHSGDSMAVLPPYRISDAVMRQIEDYTVRIGTGLGIVGLYNIQFVIDAEETLYVLEVNPRSSRTVPFLSKVTGYNLSDIATRAILGESLREQGVPTGLLPPGDDFSVKMPVFSFSKLRKVDIALGPEMKSTGEVIGRDRDLDTALYKALVAAGFPMTEFGKVLFTIADRDKEEAAEIARGFAAIGWRICATEGTCRFLRERGIEAVPVSKIGGEGVTVLDLVRGREVQLVVNTFTERAAQKISDGFLIRRESVENNIPCLTSPDTAHAVLRVLESRSFRVQAY